jgi:hypothetical protein
MNMEPWWNDIDREKPKELERNLYKYHFARHKSHMDWPGRELGLPRSNKLMQYLDII